MTVVVATPSIFKSVQMSDQVLHVLQLLTLTGHKNSLDLDINVDPAADRFASVTNRISNGLQ